MRKLLIASLNPGKIGEIRQLFQDLQFEIVSMESYPELGDVVEDKDSFTENALKKARVRADKSGLLTLADDSGLEVDYLAGRPGIYSSRFAGKDATDADNNHLLLKKLAGVPFNERQARFRCVTAVVDPVKEVEFTAEGVLEGYIVSEPAGDNGFGYDPLFYLPDYDKTVAQLPPAEKNKISHRARALEKIKGKLAELSP